MSDVKVVRAMPGPVSVTCCVCHKQIPAAWYAAHLQSAHGYCKGNGPFVNRECILFADNPGNSRVVLEHECPICKAMGITWRAETLDELKAHLDTIHK